jgi:hypothetical protein
MADPVDWRLTTFEGNRRRQHEEFRALPLSEKLARVEEMADVVRHFTAQRQARGSAGAGAAKIADAGEKTPRPGSETP